MKTFTILSSNGQLVCDVKTGVVLPEQSHYDGDDLKPVVKVDVKEFKQFFKHNIKPNDRYDFLDFGFWHEKVNVCAYVEPEKDWRNHMYR